MSLFFVVTLALLLSLSVTQGFKFAGLKRHCNKSSPLCTLASSALTNTPPSSAESSNALVALQPTLPQILVVYESESAPSFFETKPLREKVTWAEVFEHIQTKLSWEAPNQRYDNNNQGNMKIEATTVQKLLAAGDDESTLHLSIPVVVLVGLHDEKVAAAVSQKLQASADRRAVVVLDSSPSYSSLQKYGDFSPRAKGNEADRDNVLVALWRSLRSLVGANSQRKADQATFELVSEIWSRKSSDDLLFLLLILIHSYSNLTVASVVAATTSEKTGLKQLGCMCTNCGSVMLDCVRDETCKKALTCLDKCKSNDQVCAYRCITSYESDKFEKFAFCILQKNNCMGNSATIPMTPDPSPLHTFRGEALTFEAAENIFIGHLTPREGERNALLPTARPDELSEASWLVVCGQNPAYDYFSDQHQIFYREKSRPSIVWYDPVFKVTTLDGQQVWRRRHYRVRRAKQPGQFRFTVIDNGVLSDEYWRILDAADDLEWAVFYYSGAASAAGTSYTGALIVSKTGAWPAGMLQAGSETHKRISYALDRAGIKLWEIFPVTNTRNSSENSAGEPPLGVK